MTQDGEKAFNASDEIEGAPARDTGHPLEPVPSRIDVLEVTQASPYREPNFIGTYLAICLGALSAYGGFVMPATSLALIDADIGMSTVLLHRQ